MELPVPDLSFQLAQPRYYAGLNRLILQSLAMCLTAFIIPGLKITSFFGPVLAVLAIALVNATAWSSDLFFSVPLTFTENTISIVVANGILFWGLIKVLPGIEVKGVLPSIIAPILFTVINMAAHRYGDHLDFISFGQKGIRAVEAFTQNLREARNGEVSKEDHASKGHSHSPKR